MIEAMVRVMPMKYARRAAWTLLKLGMHCVATPFVNEVVRRECKRGKVKLTSGVDHGWH